MDDVDLVHNHRRIVPAPGIPHLDIDPYEESILLDPYAWYGQLRAAGPVVHLTEYNILAVGRYDETRAVFKDHAQFCSSRGVGLDDFAAVEPVRPRSIILEVDPPEHHRARRVLADAMSRAVISDLEAGFLATARDLIEAVPNGEVFDAVELLAKSYPSTAFPEAVGMADVNREHLLDYSNMVFNAVGPDNQLRQDAVGRSGEFVPWVIGACARAQLSSDGIGALVYAAADEGSISEDEASLLVRSLLTAGIDTTVGGIGGMLAHLGRSDDAWALLQEDPSLISSCVEETLRLDSPVHGFSRTAKIDTEIAGFPVEEGTKVLCVLGAANTDPERFGPDADVFRVDRAPTGHIAFGAGIHVCVGHALARSEMQMFLTALVEQVEGIELAGPAQWRPNNSLRTLSSLPMRVIKKTAG